MNTGSRRNSISLIVRDWVTPSQKSAARGKSPRWSDTHAKRGRPEAKISLSSVLSNWAALVALWALPYLTLLNHFRPEAARSETLQWSLVIIGVLGVASLLYVARRETLDPKWRAKHGLTDRERFKAPGH